MWKKHTRPGPATTRRSLSTIPGAIPSTGARTIRGIGIRMCTARSSMIHGTIIRTIFPPSIQHGITTQGTIIITASDILPGTTRTTSRTLSMTGVRHIPAANQDITGPTVLVTGLGGADPMERQTIRCRTQAVPERQEGPARAGGSQPRETAVPNPDLPAGRAESIVPGERRRNAVRQPLGSVLSPDAGNPPAARRAAAGRGEVPMIAAGSLTRRLRVRLLLLRLPTARHHPRVAAVREAVLEVAPTGTAGRNAATDNILINLVTL